MHLSSSLIEGLKRASRCSKTGFTRSIMSTRSSPFYILFSHSTLSPAPSSTLGHPTIQYHYADDSPLSLLPQPQEHVLLLDFQPDSNSPPPVRSISKAVTVTGIKVDEGIVAAPVDGRNEKMYIIETTSLDDPQRYV